MSKKSIKYVLFLILLVCFPAISIAHQKTINSHQIATPLEKSGFTRLTSHTELVAYLNKIDSLSTKVTIRSIGKSVEGRDIPLVMITEDEAFGSQRSIKPIVLIFCQQHGNEPSGKEAALILIGELAAGSFQDLLQCLDVMIVPMVNPDGAEKGKRRNANDMDLNRNHVILSEPEVCALHQLFLEWMPEVTLDVHEYNAISKQWISHGFIKDAEQMLDRVSNLNIDSTIIEFSSNVFIPEVGELIEKDGFRFHRYIVGAPFENQRIRHSTTNINDGRQSLGIYSTLSFIFEGKRYGDLINKIERRTRGQVSALTAFLKTVAKHRKEILKIVGSARNELLTGSQHISYIQLDYFPDSSQQTLTLPVFDLYAWRHTEKKLENYEPIVKVKKSVKKPHAYIFSKDEQNLIDLLFRHQIEMHLLKNDTDIEVEAYEILYVTPIIEEEKPGHYVDVDIEKKTMKMAKGSVVVFLQQKAGNLIPLLLEPQSSFGICTERSGLQYRFAQYLQEEKEYPIFRLMNPVKLDLRVFERKL